MIVKQRLIYVGSKAFDFKTDDGGQLRMSKVSLIDPNNVTDEKEAHGHVVSDIRGTYEFFEELSKLKPLSVYDFDIDIVIDGKKVTPRVIGVTPVK